MEIQAEADSNDSAKCSQDDDQCAAMFDVSDAALGDGGIMFTGCLSGHPLTHISRDTIYLQSALNGQISMKLAKYLSYELVF